MPAVVQLLAEYGAITDIIHPVHGMLDLSQVRVEHDLYVLRHTSGLSLSLSGALHELGAVIVNPYPTSAILRDKIIVSRILQASGIPTPATYVASQPVIASAARLRAAHHQAVSGDRRPSRSYHSIPS